MVSLLKLAEITEEGVRFQNPYSAGARGKGDKTDKDKGGKGDKEETEKEGKSEKVDEADMMMLTPEQSIQCQNEIGADIMMQVRE